MNLIGLCLYFLLVACSGARAFHLLAQSLQQTIRSPIIDVAKLQDVPGDSPVKYCEGSNPGSDLFQVDTFDSHPNPLRRLVGRAPCSIKYTELLLAGSPLS